MSDSNDKAFFEDKAMTTPAPCGDVPQWCRDAAKQILSEESENLIGRQQRIAAIIARYAPRAEAGEVETVESTPGNNGLCDEALPAAPKWPREVIKAIAEHEQKFRATFELRPDLKGHPMWEDAYEHAATHQLYPDELSAIGAATVRKQTDASGNALSAPSEAVEVSSTGGGFRTSKAFTAQAWADHGEPAAALPTSTPSEASGVERWDIRGVITLGDEPPYVIEKYRNGQFVKASDHDRVVLAKDAEIAEYAENLADTTHDLQDRVKLLAERDAEIAELRKEVKRLSTALDENWTTHQQIINARTVRNGEYDKLHAMLVAEQQEHGRTGVELNEYVESCKHWRQRAEAAEAKCAEYRDTFTATNEMRLSGVRLRQAVQQRAELAEMHCTEALDRLEVANAQLAELRSSSAVYERDMHAALDRITDATDRIAKAFGESIGHGLPIDGPGGCVAWCLGKYAEVSAANERMRALLIQAKPYIKQPHDVSKPWVVNEIDAALAAAKGGAK